jgi:hypothetical protein
LAKREINKNSGLMQRIHRFFESTKKFVLFTYIMESRPRASENFMPNPEFKY